MATKQHPRVQQTAPTLTLHQGGAQREFIEHPVERARQALREAAKLEYDAGHLEWASIMSQVASALPEQKPLPGAVS
jgi:hypothetical protein